MNQELHARLLAQLAADYNTSPDALRSSGCIFTRNAFDPAKRIYLNRDKGPLRVLLLGNTAVFRCGSAALEAALRDAFSGYAPEWLLSIRALHALDAVLAGFGTRVEHQQLYFLPNDASAGPSGDWTLRWYEAAELERFRGDSRFSEALSFVPDMPDVLAVTAEKGGTILGMAGASRDGADFWQIGVNVEPFARGRGIASALTAALKQEILRRGALPFYGTAPSHIHSQRVALAAGFVPMWAELRTAATQKED